MFRQVKGIKGGLPDGVELDVKATMRGFTLLEKLFASPQRFTA